MANIEIKRNSLREFLKEKAEKVSMEAMRPPFPTEWTLRDVSNGKVKYDFNKKILAADRVKLAIDSGFMSENKRSVTIFEYEKIIKESGNAGLIPVNMKPCNGNEGVILGDDGRFPKTKNVNKSIAAW